MKKIFNLFFLVVLLGTLTSCNSKASTVRITESVSVVPLTATDKEAEGVPQPSLTPEPPKVLTICMAQEPASLFYYADQTLAARNIYQAIYDGPIDYRDFYPQAVILERIPSLENGDVTFSPVDVEKGDKIIDDYGRLVLLDEGVRYRPSGCLSTDCAVEYQGDERVQIDVARIRYHLLSGLKWSDGVSLTASDSVFSYKIASHIFAGSRWKQLYYVQSYSAVDDQTVDWVGLPGFQGVRPSTFFFAPLPEHVLGSLSLESMLTSDIASKEPIGWGAYRIKEWTAGDHVTMEKNPFYYRASEGLPPFDFLVYRFIPDIEQALTALEIGECDILDSTFDYDVFNEETKVLIGEKGIFASKYIGASWEQISFGIVPVSEEQTRYFGVKDTRRAFGMCIDKEKLVASLGYPPEAVLGTYLPSVHPLALDKKEAIPYDQDTAMDLLDAIGWRDDDHDSQTPRKAFHVSGVLDGTEFRVTYFVPDDQKHMQVANAIAEMVFKCGIALDVKPLPWNELMNAGPDGVVFGRQFDVAQFAWATDVEPECILYKSDEIPGAYPDYPMGWGGGNATGFANSDFDRVCSLAGNSPESSEAYRDYHKMAQEIFVEELPSYPLFLNVQVVLTNPEITGFEEVQYGEALFENLEEIGSIERTTE